MRCEAELERSKARQRQLEETQAQVRDRIAWALDSLHSILDRQGLSPPVIPEVARYPARLALALPHALRRGMTAADIDFWRTRRKIRPMQGCGVRREQ